MSPPRLGLLDLAVVGCVLVAVWSHSPVGGLAQHAFAWLIGDASELPALTASFSLRRLQPPVALPELPELPTTGDGTGFPEPARTAALKQLESFDSPALRLALASQSDVPEDQRKAALLDAMADQPVPQALERLAIGDSPRRRAIERARAAGERQPEQLTAHRRFLSAEDQKRADSLVESSLALATVLDIQWPLQTPHRVSSPWGFRMHPIKHKRSFHNGVDLATPIGTPLHAVQDGVIKVAASDPKLSGNFVVIDHGHGVRSVYCHLDRFVLSQGAKVTRGQVFAMTGNTGPSTGPHVHFIVRIHGKSVDPMRLKRAATKS